MSFYRNNREHVDGLIVPVECIDSSPASWSQTFFPLTNFRMLYSKELHLHSFLVYHGLHKQILLHFFIFRSLIKIRMNDWLVWLFFFFRSKYWIFFRLSRDHWSSSSPAVLPARTGPEKDPFGCALRRSWLLKSTIHDVFCDASFPIHQGNFYPSLAPPNHQHR